MKETGIPYTQEQEKLLIDQYTTSIDIDALRASLKNILSVKESADIFLEKEQAIEILGFLLKNIIKTKVAKRFQAGSAYRENSINSFSNNDQEMETLYQKAFDIVMDTLSQSVSNNTIDENNIVVERRALLRIIPMVDLLVDEYKEAHEKETMKKKDVEHQDQAMNLFTNKIETIARMLEIEFPKLENDAVFAMAVSWYFDEQDRRSNSINNAITNVMNGEQGIIYGNGGYHRYYVNKNGDVRFSDRHGPRASENAKKSGF